MTRPTPTEAFHWLNAQLVTTQQGRGVRIHEVSTFCPVSFGSPVTLRAPRDNIANAIKSLGHTSHRH